MSMKSLGWTMVIGVGREETQQTRSGSDSQEDERDLEDSVDRSQSLKHQMWTAVG
jgi:hypothetical protein